MAISFVQITAGNFTSTTASPFALSFGSGITAGSIIAVFGTFNNAATFSSLSDGHSDTVTDSGNGVVKDSSGTGNSSFCKAFLTPTAGATTISLAWTGGSIGFGELVLYEIAGLTSPQFDKAPAPNLFTGNTSSPTNATGTLSAANEAIIAYCTTSGAVQTLPSSPWVSGQGSSTTGNTGDGIIPNSTDGAVHQIVSATTTQTATFVVSSTGDKSDNWIATFMSGAVVAAPINVLASPRRVFLRR